MFGKILKEGRIAASNQSANVCLQALSPLLSRPFPCYFFPKQRACSQAISLSLVDLFHAVGHQKGRNSDLGLFIERKYAVSFNNLCRKYREPDLYCINKKTGIPTLFHSKPPAIPFHAARNTSHTHPHNKWKQWKVSFNLPPSLYPQPSGPKLWTFSAGCLGDGW